jgi:hypothetical protein
VLIQVQSLFATDQPCIKFYYGVNVLRALFVAGSSKKSSGQITTLKEPLNKPRVFKTSKATTTAAERQKICSPRRQPWVRVGANERAAERRNDIETMFCPCWGWVVFAILVPWLTPWATDLSPLHG